MVKKLAPLLCSLLWTASSQAAPVCDIQLNQTTYIEGSTVTANAYRFANLSNAPIATEIKIWLGVPDIAPISVANAGSDGSVELPAGLDFDYGAIPLFPVTAGLPYGNYEFSCRLLDPVTGELFAEDRNFFEVKSPVINNFPRERFFSAFGEPFAPYYAQTFKALPGVATNLAIELSGGSGPDNTDFHVLITEVSGSGLDFHPTTVLFESPMITFSSSAPPTIISIPLPDLVLVPGATYAFILDAFVTRDGLDGRSLIATNGTHPDGALYFNQGFAGNTRAEHFADGWQFTESIYPPDIHDMAFQLTFVGQ